MFATRADLNHPAQCNSTRPFIFHCIDRQGPIGRLGDLECASFSNVPPIKVVVHVCHTLTQNPQIANEPSHEKMGRMAYAPSYSDMHLFDLVRAFTLREAQDPRMRMLIKAFADRTC